jgi:hypothetical protein
MITQMLVLATTTEEKLQAARAVFLKVDEELIRDAWAHHLSEMEGVLDLPKARPPHDVYPIGLVDKVRRHLLRLVPAGRGEPASPSLLQRILTLAGGRNADWPSLSRETQILIAEALEVRKDEWVYCSDVGTVGLALHLAAARQARVVLDVSSLEVANLAPWLARAAATEIGVRVAGDRAPQPVHWPRAMMERGATNNDFDVAVLNLPWGVRQGDRDTGGSLGRLGQTPGSSEAAHIVQAARWGRRAACVVPSGYLFRTTQAEQLAKKEAILRYGLDAIVALPRDALGRHTGVAAALVLLRSVPDDDRRHLLMVDPRGEAERGGDWHLVAAEAVRERETGDVSTLVSVDELEAQDLNLAVDRYVLGSEARRVRDLLAQAETRLDDLAELYRPQALLASTAGRNRRAEYAEDPPEYVDGERIVEVGVADIDEAGLVRDPQKLVPSTPEVVQRSRKARLEPGDILIVNKGSVGKVAFVREVPKGETWVASQSFVIVRLRRGAPVSDPLVLFRFLSSGIGQAAIRSLSVGTTIPGILMNDVRRLPVLMPPADQQVVVASEVRDVFATHDHIQRMREDAARRLRALWPDGGDDSSGLRGAAA